MDSPHITLTKMGPHDEPKAFIDLFEQAAQTWGWPIERRVARLLPFLTGEVQLAVQQLLDDSQLNYSDLKRAILQAPMQDSERDQEGGPKEDNGETPVSDDVEVPGPSVENAVKPVVIDLEECDYNETDNDWKLIKEPARAAKVFKENLLREHANGETLKMKMDVRGSEEEREQQLLSFYKQQQKWACPLNCTLAGDAAVGEGVMRFFMTTIISKLQFGFSLGLGKFPTVLLDNMVLCLI
ncbi:uncharacterized protein LOC132892211 [Neoarius graeffei]|uniref:uncharacterized protein LOC132892211 n=1 Tax=Neoarius graeffei TaxID=443677 RepID=UPI00298CBA52|nr:uncharacterized protein LOC132892211 [Neoarius graeffei]